VRSMLLGRVSSMRQRVIGTLSVASFDLKHQSSVDDPSSSIWRLRYLISETGYCLIERVHTFGHADEVDQMGYLLKNRCRYQERTKFPLFKILAAITDSQHILITLESSLNVQQIGGQLVDLLAIVR